MSKKPTILCEKNMMIKKLKSQSQNKNIFQNKKKNSVHLLRTEGAKA